MFFKKTLSVILLLLFIIPYNVLAYSDYIIASGQNIGIEIKSKGVIVVGTYKVEDNDIALKSEIRVGDIIKTINGDPISTVDDLVKKINTVTNDNIKIGYIRNDISKYTNLKLQKVKNTYKTGLYVKDSITGIGTLTYIDPNTKLFGALGHEIVEKNTGKILETNEGKIFNSEVIGLVRSTNGVPGEKNARYYSNQINGIVNENTNKGIFGEYTVPFDTSKLYKVANSSEIKKGKAKILTVLNGTDVDEYDINIINISKLGSTKNLVFEITDKKLLEKTGGIIQGMSGSPIIQGNNIIGAVTHVIVDNPTKGYGIFITNMLEESEN
ncbi:MAG: SpoIVB peptidase [Bacilli bacterium]|nr:SpoIVB peptidase [Bacilli bacterium]MDD4733687.1 SpoIVB peptidase [Bacilli bacterium]